MFHDIPVNHYIGDFARDFAHIFISYLPSNHHELLLITIRHDIPMDIMDIPKVYLVIPSGYVKIAIEHGPVEIVSCPIQNGGSFHRFLYVYQAGYPLVNIQKTMERSTIFNR